MRPGRKDIGLAIVGSGRIGTLRGRLAGMHPSVRFIGVMDTDAVAAQKLSATIDAAFCTTELDAVLSHPDVNAVIVSSSEGEHAAPVLAALKRGLPVLVEKPIALTVPESDLMLRTVRELGGDLRVGYSRRYKTRYLLAKEQLLQGRLGTITGACARLYNSRAQCLAMLGRNPHATPIVDALTYYVDLMGWLLADNPVTEVFARGQKGVIQRAGHDVDDVT